MAVRLLGGRDMTPETQEFMNRFGVGAYPTLLAMNSRGEVVARDFRRDVPSMLAAMRKAE